ncbi:GntR family transcriptional regulator [Sphaerisporangium fuscum]|uniref:GntR family transcriptional regulator n=1 Tax=Sphaerisporangium fuscum TaxID=2835868 RepID=UPI001BDBC779|nr:winged helix-turn-helix domain-containing protein [Sphaerisporangium fuscum]
MSKPTDRRRPYVRIADDLRQDIASGRYAHGEQLPAARVLADRYGVAMMTVGNALAVLREEGLIETRHGTGSFVTAQPDSAPERTAPAEEHSEEFLILSEQLKEIRDHLRRLASRIDQLESQVHFGEPQR